MKFFFSEKPVYEPIRISGDIDNAVAATHFRKRSRWCKWPWARLLILEAVHLTLFLGWLGWAGHVHVFEDSLSSSYRSLHRYDGRAVFDEKDYESRNMDEALWKDLFPDAQGIISIPKSSKLASTLMPTRTSPLNQGHSLYQVSLFHHLHCLEMIKDMLIDTKHHYTHGSHKHKDSGTEGDTNGHSMHCIDWIRQALMCNADLTLDPTDDFLSFGQDSEHKCRDFGKILEWTQHHRYMGSLKKLESLS